MSLSYITVEDTANQDIGDILKGLGQTVNVHCSMMKHAERYGLLRNLRRWWRQVQMMAVMSRNGKDALLSSIMRLMK